MLPLFSVLADEKTGDTTRVKASRPCCLSCPRAIPRAIPTKGGRRHLVPGEPKRHEVGQLCDRLPGHAQLSRGGEEARSGPLRDAVRVLCEEAHVAGENECCARVRVVLCGVACVLCCVLCCATVCDVSALDSWTGCILDCRGRRLHAHSTRLVKCGIWRG